MWVQLTHEEVKYGHIHDVQQSCSAVVGRSLLDLLAVVRIHLPPERFDTHFKTFSEKTFLKCLVFVYSLCLLALVIGAPPRVPPGLALGQGQVWEEGSQGPLDLVRFAAQSVFGGAVVRALAVEAHIVGCERTREAALAQLAVNHPGSLESLAPVMSLKCCNNAELMPVNGPLIQLCLTLGRMKLFSFPQHQFWARMKVEMTV